MPDSSGPTLVSVEPSRFARKRANSVQNPVTRPRAHRSHSHTSDIDLVSPQLLQFTTSAPTPSLPPPRPHRNPARLPGSVAESYALPKPPLIVNTVFPRVQRTGPQEEITPWELEPFPPESKSYATEFTPASAASIQQNPGHGAGSSLSSFVRRRKSTGGKMFRPKSTTPVRSATGKPHLNSISPQPTRSTSKDSPQLNIGLVSNESSSSTTALKPSKSSSADSPSLISPSESATRAIDRFPFASAAPKPITSPQQHSSSANQDQSKRQQLNGQHHPSQSSPAGPAFSTADRTILAELKRSLIAHESQFKQKSGQKHHPFSRQEVPYPCSYERSILDWDIWETMFCQQLCGSLTWHVFETHPGRVLDLGCGTGTWILDCARAWRECTFVGVDIVPLHPDLMRVGSDLASRVTWLQANFLDGLPFPNEEFDYVHIKRIARGVPEDKWDFLLAEIVRVMKPGAAFEMIEEDLFFPGQLSSDEENSDEDGDEDGLYNPMDARQSMSSEGDSSVGRPWSGLEPPSSLTSTASSPSIISPAVPPSTITEVDEDASPMHGVDDQSVLVDSNTHPSPMLARMPGLDLTGSPHTTSQDQVHQKEQAPASNLAKKGDYPRPSASSSRVGVGGATSQSLVSSSTASLGFHREQRSPPSPGSRLTMGATLAVAAMGPFMGVSPPQLSSLSCSTPNPETALTLPTKTNTPLLLKTLPKPPVNPRNHSLLNTIYQEMHSARFINLTPLSILASSLSGYLKGIRTHPPLQFHFPPKPHTADGIQPSSHRAGNYANNDEKGDILPPALSRSHRTAQHETNLFSLSSDDPHPALPLTSSGDTGPEGHFLSMKNLLQHTSPYVTLDGSRMSGFAPAARPLLSPRAQGTDKERTISPSTQHRPLDAFPGYTSNAAHHTNHVQTRSQLPNETIRFDIRTLNLHLALRASEVLACSEAMWEWVLEFQHQRRDKRVLESKVAARRSRSGSLIGAGDASKKTQRPAIPKSILEQRLEEIDKLARADFEELLFNFKFDMRDQTMLGTVLADRFGWANLPNVTPNADRDMFDKACQKWEEDAAMRRQLRHQERMSRQPYLHETAPLRHHSSGPSTVGAMSSPSSIHSAPSHLGLREGPCLEPTNIGGSRMLTSLSSTGRSLTDSKRDHRKTTSPRLSRAMRVFVAWKEE